MLIEAKTLKESPIVFMFSGQGSQYYRMGWELYERNPRFTYWLDHCNEITFPLLQRSLADIIYDPPDRYASFERVVYSNPALLSMQFCISQLLQENGIKPDYCLGYSIGELTAAVIAESLSLEEALGFLVDYSVIVEAHTSRASMLAILEEEAAVDIGNCWVTGRNLSNHFVIAGIAEEIRKTKSVLDNIGIVNQLLPVNIGFHTELMDPVEEQVKTAFGKITVRPFSSKIISCYQQGLIDQFDSDHFWKVVRYPVEFGKTLASMLTNGSYRFIDVGPSGTLSTFVKHSLSQDTHSQALEAMNQFGKNVHTLDKLFSEFSRY